MLLIEVVFAYRHQQTLKTVEVQEGSTVQEAIEASGLLALYPEIELSNKNVGIFSKPTTLSAIVKSGDRIEIYRELLIDPKQARRSRAEQS